MDRRAIRDALVAHDLLRIRPRRSPQAIRPDETIHALAPQREAGAGILELTTITTSSVVGEEQSESEKVHSSTNKLSASGKH